MLYTVAHGPLNRARIITCESYDSTLIGARVLAEASYCIHVLKNVVTSTLYKVKRLVHTLYYKAYKATLGVVTPTVRQSARGDGVGYLQLPLALSGLIYQ